MQRFTIKKKMNRTSPHVRQPGLKRVRLIPTLVPEASRSVLSVLPPLPPPQRNCEGSKSSGASSSRRSTSPAATKNASKLAELRCNFLGDIVMVIQELKVILTYGPGSACPDAPVPPSVMLKLVRTVQTLEKLRTLLLMDPARLQRVSLTQLETVEQQITRNLLPLATLLRSFEGEENCEAVSPVEGMTIKREQSWEHLVDKNSSHTLAVAPPPRHDWRFLSMALSLQL